MPLEVGGSQRQLSTEQILMHLMQQFQGSRIYSLVRFIWLGPPPHRSAGLSFCTLWLAPATDLAAGQFACRPITN
jgi:hypothetical protein